MNPLHSILRHVLTALPVVLFLLVVAPSAGAKGRPNILLILADDMGYGELACQGNPQIPTPNIDSIAKNGIRFTSGYVTSPVCSPSRAGLMTGRYGVRFGMDLNPGFSHTVGLPLTEKTMAQRLKALGYVTGMFGKWHLGFPPKMQPRSRGFDEFYGFLGAAHSYLHAHDRHDRGNAILRGDQPAGEIDYLTDELGREAAAFIEKHRDKPWFVYLPFNAVHGPLESVPKYTDRFAAISDNGRRTYAGVEAAMDDAVGVVLGKLRELKIEDNTLIIFLSDNGAPDHKETRASNLPLRGYKSDLWEGGIRVPFMIQWKGHLPAGKVDERPVISLDILPTAMAAAGAPMADSEKLDGVNLLPFLADGNAALPHDALFWRFGYRAQRAVRMGDWKLLAQGKKVHLYHLAVDIREKDDLAEKEPEKVKEMESAWRKWDASNKRNRKAPANTVTPDPEATAEP